MSLNDDLWTILTELIGLPTLVPLWKVPGKVSGLQSLLSSPNNLGTNQKPCDKVQSEGQEANIHSEAYYNPTKC